MYVNSYERNLCNNKTPKRHACIFVSVCLLHIILMALTFTKIFRMGIRTGQNIGGYNFWPATVTLGLLDWPWPSTQRIQWPKHSYRNLFKYFKRSYELWTGQAIVGLNFWPSSMNLILSRVTNSCLLHTGWMIIWGTFYESPFKRIGDQTRMF